MELKFSRSFFGYDEEEVEHQIKLQTKQYEEQMRKLTNRLFDINQENEMAQSRINAIRLELDNYQDKSQKIMEFLFVHHLLASKEVYHAITAGETIDRKLEKDILETAERRNNIKETLDSLNKELEVLAENYYNVLEAYKNG
ncbi:MAG: hypothetical protein RBT41_04375 [Clostridia bacterium]|nr:hypothetical protein [Clostridia bacterium]